MCSNQLSYLDLKKVGAPVQHYRCAMRAGLQCHSLDNGLPVEGNTHILLFWKKTWGMESWFLHLSGLAFIVDWHATLVNRTTSTILPINPSRCGFLSLIAGVSSLHELSSLVLLEIPFIFTREWHLIDSDIHLVKCVATYIWRTPVLLSLCHLRQNFKFIGGHSRARTYSLLVNSQLLYHWAMCPL